jgi:uncharacterized protein YecT (DUF1311 family)
MKMKNLAKMKRRKLFLILTLGIICSTSFSQTQSELNQKALESYKKADKELNTIYQKILSEYKSDTLFIKNLKASQRIWITFRDAELNMKYPERDPNYYGSIQPTCVAMYLEQLTKERIKTLKVWLVGIPEGDCCSGTVKIKE